MQAVILAGGEGFRLRPLTRSRPKALIPVGNHPIIEYTINALVENGIRDITVVVGYRREQVVRYLNQSELDVNVVVQEKQLGAADALKCAEESVTGRFILLPGDNYIDSASVAQIKSAGNALLVAEHPQPSNFGVVTIRDGQVCRIIEKPDIYPGLTVSTGVFSLDETFFDYLNSLEIPEAVNSMIRNGTSVRAIPTGGWQDAIYPWNLLKMNSRVLKSLSACRSGYISRGATISGSVQIGKGTKIGPGTVIEGPVIIGDDCVIGPDACIMPDTSIGSRVSVEPFTYLKNSIIMDDVKISSHSRCVDSVIGEGAVLSDHISTVTGIFSAEDGGSGRLITGEFGAILGDRVSAAPFTVFKHCIVGNNVSIEEGRLISGTVKDNVVVK